MACERVRQSPQQTQNNISENRYNLSAVQICESLGYHTHFGTSIQVFAPGLPMSNYHPLVQFESHLDTSCKKVISTPINIS